MTTLPVADQVTDTVVVVFVCTIQENRVIMCLLLTYIDFSIIDYDCLYELCTTAYASCLLIWSAQHHKDTARSQSSEGSSHRPVS